MERRGKCVHISVCVCVCLKDGWFECTIKPLVLTLCKSVCCCFREFKSWFCLTCKQIQTDSEELLIIKTRESLLEALTEHVKANHEYE